MAVGMVSPLAAGEEVGPECCERAAWGGGVKEDFIPGMPQRMTGISQRDKFGERYSRQRELLLHSSRGVRKAGNRMGTGGWAG